MPLTTTLTITEKDFTLGSKCSDSVKKLYPNGIINMPWNAQAHLDFLTTSEEHRAIVNELAFRGIIPPPNFENADLQNVVISGAYLGGANFKGANLTGATIKESNLLRADFSNAIATKINLSQCNLNFTSFRYTKASLANFSESELFRSNFSYAKMLFADFSSCDSMVNMVIHDTDFRFSNFSRCHIRDTRVSETKFSHCDFNRVRISDATIQECSFGGVKNFETIKLDNTTFFDTTFYENENNNSQKILEAINAGTYSDLTSY